ncbi:MAG: hypothetical protein RR620_00660 [Clostridium sp.]
MSLTPKFSAVDKSVLVSTGNSLVICGSSTAVENNTSDMIKITGDSTRDWTQAGSSATLNILTSSTILYAELVWYSTVKSNVQGALDLRSIQDNAITFKTSQGTYQITPTYTDSYTAPSGSIDRYRAADITTYVQASMTGSYSVSNVPISMPSTGLSNTRAGWTLVVIYRNDQLKPQKILYSSGISVATPSTPLQSTLSGFTTSSDSTLLKGSLFLSCANGEPLNGEEYLYAGPSFAQLSNVGNTVNSPNPNPGTTPNNPGNSFFSGAINIADPLNSNNGLLNINGTNGTNNNDGFVPTQTVGDRNKWDITNVDISKTLVPNQTLLAGEITEGVVGDGIQLVALGAQVLVKAPNITVTLETYDIDGDGEYNVQVGEPLVYAIHIKNDGDVDANNVNISAVINSVTSFVAGSVTVNGVSIPSANIVNGINVGTVNARGIINVFFTVKVNSVPVGGLLHQFVNYNYSFISGIDNITNVGKTNTIDIIVQSGLLSITKSASKTTIALNDTVNYTIDISNIGTELAREVFFQDKIDASSSFVIGTVVIDGIAYADYNPSEGFSLSDLAVGESTQIVFQSKVNSLPPSTTVKNVSFVSFGYIYNQYGYLKVKTITSNTTSILVQYVEVIGERCNDNNYPNIGDIVNYTLSLTNVGNLPAENVQVLESPIIGASFVAGSVMVNGTIAPTLNPFNGFILQSPIGAGQTTTVQYQVLINSINPANLIENIATVPFKYQMTDGGTTIDSEKDSNKVDTTANYVCMNLVKSVDKAYALIGDTLYYSVKVTNNGNIDATNTVFVDSIQAEAAFVVGSVAINGIVYPAYNPTQGFSLGTICSGDEIYVTFQVKVNTLPSPNIIHNQSDLVYSYQPDPNGSVTTNTLNSNTVQTIINRAQYTIVKSVNKEYAQVGDALVYTTVINNTGTVPLTNMKFADYLGVFLTFQQGSLYIDGENYPNLDPSNQFPIINMNPGDTMTIVFGAVIAQNPPVGYIPNISEVIISYKQNPDSPIITKTAYSNEVITYDPNATLTIVKAVDKPYAIVGDVLNYSFTVANSGNTAAINTLFADYLQGEISFVSGSVSINGASRPDYNPESGFTLGTIQSGQVITIEFKAIVDSLPIPNTVINNATTSFSYYVDPTQQPITKNVTSNTVTTVINSYSATLAKAVDKAYAKVGEVLDYTVTLNNSGTVTLSNINFTDIIQSGGTFVSGSVIVDGVSIPSADPNSGFIVDDVLAGGSTVIRFQSTVTSVPTPPQINNTGSVTFKYKLIPTSDYINGSLTSNTVTTNITTMTVTNTKSASKTYATVGDTITYSSVVTNSGNTSITNTMFLDTVPSSTTFVAGSVKINGIPYASYNPNTGFTLGTLQASTVATVTFDVVVNTVPSNGYITNTSVINYQYKVDPNGSYISGSTTSNTITTYINFGNLTVTKAADRDTARISNIITYNFVVTNTGNTILKNLNFTDLIQSESSFNIGSVYVNDINMVNYDPNNGFGLSDIPIGQQTLISFKVTANSIPTNNQLLNTANVAYSYYVDPNGTPISSTKNSNTTTVYVYDTILSVNKEVDKQAAKIGDILNFSISIRNDGNTPAQHVVFTDLVDSNISFISDSVYVNGVQKVGYNPNNGFNLSDIQEGTTTTVTFEATVITRPANNIVYNFATIDYDYIVGSDVITAKMNSNITQTYIAVGELTITNAVDKGYATVGDDLNYTVIVKNTGSVNTTNLNFTDFTPLSTSFMIGTVVIDGVPQPTYNPNTGFILGDLTPSQYHTITFSLHVDSLPASGKVETTANVDFTYKLTPTDNPITTTANSNTVTTLIKIGLLTATKAVDKAYATIGDTLNYTVTLNNSGNTSCVNLLFKDTIQSNASFVSGSVKINGVTYGGYNPNTGFNIDDIPAYGSLVVTFAVTVQTLPTDYVIYNTASVDYKYYIDPANQPVSKSATSNTVTTVINIGILTATKSVSKAYATIGDTVTYTVDIANTGNTIAKNVNFRDVVPTGLTFVAASVVINGVSYPSYNPYGSFTLGNINPGDSVVVKFDTTVTSLPNPSLVSNTANITFAYRIDPNGSDIPVQFNSNTVTTQINLGQLTLSKLVDKLYCTKGDVLTYTVTVTNSGNVPATNVIFTDDLQSDITFNTGSVKVNGTTHSSYDPNVGFDLGTMQPLDVVTVVFTATVINTPSQSSVLNYAVATFNYKIDPNGQEYNKSYQSNTVYTIIIMPNLTTTETVDKAYTTLQDTLNYSVLVKNEGNTTISQLFFTNFLSNGAQFKAGTVIIDGVSYPMYNPIDGFNLPNDLISGVTTLVQFQAIVTTLPTPPQVTDYSVANGVYYIDPQGPSYPITATSNTVTTLINIGSLTNTKVVDKLYAKVNDTVTYTSTITNTGNVNATGLFFTDMLQTELTYISGTVTINGVSYPSFNPTVGFNLSDLAPTQTVTVIFNAKINALPTPPYVTNNSLIQFSYKIDPNGSITTKTQTSNTVTTNVVLGKILVNKYVDKSIATIGDDITYTIVLTNVGNVIDNNVFFQDTPSLGATFKSGTVMVNNVSQPTYNPSTGFSLGDLGIGNVVTVSFIVTVISVPATNKVTNQAVINYQFVVDPKQQPYSDTAYSNTVTTNIAYGNLSVTKAVNKQYATVGEQITYTITIVNTGNINATNVVFLDQTPANSVYVLGSVTINGVSYPGYNPSAGFNLNTMVPGQIITVVYKVQVVQLC